MKKFAKRAAAFLLAAVLSLSLAGCYNENLTWSARKGDTELPIGAYIYYLSVAYNEAAAQIDTETKTAGGRSRGYPRRRVDHTRARPTSTSTSGCRTRWSASASR